jgi:hypothetical protein
MSDGVLPIQYFWPWKAEKISDRAIISDSLGRILFRATSGTGNEDVSLAQYVVDVLNAHPPADYDDKWKEALKEIANEAADTG